MIGFSIFRTTNFDDEMRSCPNKSAYVHSSSVFALFPADSPLRVAPSSHLRLFSFCPNIDFVGLCQLIFHVHFSEKCYFEYDYFCHIFSETKMAIKDTILIFILVLICNCLAQNSMIQGSSSRVSCALQPGEQQTCEQCIAKGSVRFRILILFRI